MNRYLLLTIRLHGDGQGTARFHGMAQGGPEWPPAPARLFQALVAGVARGNLLPEATVAALQWLEKLPAPVIGAPARRLGEAVSLFVPNNDADSLSDPRDVSGIRTKKLVHASLFPETEPIVYAWPLPPGDGDATIIIAASAQIYQLGRGIDMAWAAGEVLEEEDLNSRLEQYRGLVYRPEPAGRGGTTLACPVPGSLASLIRRHATVKLRAEEGEKSPRLLFTNAPKPRFLNVSYERARRQVVFELRDAAKSKMRPWPLRRVVKMVEKLRDSAAARLRESLPGHEEQIENTIVGRKHHGERDASIAERIRIVPLPSIGFVHADRGIRRFLLDVPCGGPLRAADVEWAFSGLEWPDSSSEDSNSLVVTRGDADMLRHYTGPSTRWRSVTPVVLPESAKRRRIEPTRQRQEAKDARERGAEEDRAVAAVHVAMRHAGIRAVATAVRVQREPFDAKGMRAEIFAEETRFAKERLWHVELELDRPVEGTLTIGDGRFLGLGLMAPLIEHPGERSTEQNAGDTPVLAAERLAGLVVLEVIGEAKDQPVVLARALRRAVMALVQRELGNGRLDVYFCGHESEQGQEAEEGAGHLGFQWDKKHARLLVIPPHLVDRREPTPGERKKLATLNRALWRLSELRAGTAGRFLVRRVSPLPGDVLIAPSRRWTSLTPYAVTRHPKKASAHEALIEDVLAECVRHRLPRPEVTVLEAHGVPGVGLEGRCQLDFSVAVSGPIVLGRTRYLGGGGFAAVLP